MRKLVIRVAVGILLLLIALTPLTSVMGRPTQLPPACEEFAFSTEEDFVSGESVISDGDLLTVYEDASGAVQCAICARNADLLAVCERVDEINASVDELNRQIQELTKPAPRGQVEEVELEDETEFVEAEEEGEEEPDEPDEGQEVEEQEPAKDTGESEDEPEADPE